MTGQTEFDSKGRTSRVGVFIRLSISPCSPVTYLHLHFVGLLSQNVPRLLKYVSVELCVYIV